MKKKLNEENRKTTKEVADTLGVSTTTIRRFLNDNKQLFKGLIMRSSRERSLASGGTLLWSDEAIKILMLNVSNPQTDQWKEEVITEYTEKGIIIAKTDNLDIIEGQAKMILNLIQAKKQQALAINKHQREIQAMQIELEDHSKIIEQHIDDLIIDESVEKIRVHIQWIYERYEKSVWNELHERFHFSKLARISEKKGKAIIEYLNIHYEIDDF